MDQNALVIHGQTGFSAAGAAYISADRKLFGLALSQSNQETAERKAEHGCRREGNDCSIELVFHRAAVAAAKSNDGRYYFSKGTSSELAGSAAVERCMRMGEMGRSVPFGHTWENDLIE